MKLRKTKETKKEDLTEVVDKMTKSFDKELKKESKEINEIVSDATQELDFINEEVKEEKKVEEKPKEVKNMSAKRKRKFKIDLPVVVFIAILLIVGGIVIFLTIGNGGSKYGERLKGIEKISFSKKEKDKFVKGIKANENVNSVSIDIQGKIIYVMVDVKENVSIEDARNIMNGSLENLSDKVKGFYDINALVTKKEEKPVEEVKTDTEGNETKIEHKDFPISGYKNNSSDHIVW